MKRKILCLPAGLAFMCLSVQAQEYQPLSLSGFNEKIIAYSNLPATATTSTGIDTGDRALMNTTFSTMWGMPGPSYALPPDGLINSAATEGISFQLADANTANVLRIPGQNETGTLQFTEGAEAANLYLLATSGDEGATITVTVTFTDDTSQAFTGVDVPNWLGGSGQPITLQGFGYVKREMNQIENPANDPRLFQIALDILPENEAKTVHHITVAKTSAEGIVNIFAVTAELADTCPTPAPAAEDQVTCAGSTLSDLAVDGAEGATLTWYDAQNAGNILDPNLPVSDATYYVSQTADGCESHRTAITVTINPGPHMPEGEELQEFSEGETVGDLEVSFEDGTTPVWYVMNDAGESITVTADTPLEDGVTYFVAQMLDGCRSEALRITVSQILGTGSHSAFTLTAYPNPAGESITLSGDKEVKEINIVNLLGQKLLQQEGNGTVNVVNLAGLSSGHYILSYRTIGGQTGTLKLVKK